MSQASISIFISHIKDEEAIALALKSFLESTFLNATVFVSGKDLCGGDVWAKQLRGQLETSTVIIAIVSPCSACSTWVHFEAGAGFIRECTIPVVVDGLQIRDLKPPFSLL